MMDVKPWEPVKGYYVDPDDPFENPKDYWDWSDPGVCRRLGQDALRVTLANGQRIIVRALSEDRKASRRARQGASK